jgi:transposase
MKSVQGKPLTPETKRNIVSAKLYFDTQQVAPHQSSTKRTAKALGVGEASVKRVMAKYNKNPDFLDEPPADRGRPVHSISSSMQEEARGFIREANINGEHITLSGIKVFLDSKDPNNSFHLSTLSRTLGRWGFEFGKGTRSQHLKEKDSVIASRRRYLRMMKKNRKAKGGTVRPEVYLDESYINKNHSNDFIWYASEDGPWVQKPTGKGERLILINAITKSGWVTDAKLVFKSTRKTGDYHGQMNFELFEKWFEEKLLPNIPKQSIIVMDNASYHNRLSEDSPPTKRSSKIRIKSFLEKKGVSCDDDLLKAELIEILEKINPTPIYALDKMAKKLGHTVIRTPPYHPELQPIEICWGIVKNHAGRNCDFTMKNLELQLNKGFGKVTPETCSKIINKIRIVEDRFWVEDTTMDRYNS